MSLQPDQSTHARMPSFRLGKESFLVPLHTRDAAELFALVNQNRERLRQWLSWVDHHGDLTSVQALIAMTHRDFEKGRAVRLGIRHQGSLAGIAALQRIDAVHRSASLGYWIGAGFEGKGLVSAAATALCRYGFEILGLGRLELATATGNHRSKAVARRLGFQLEGVLRCREWLYDHYVDHEVYSLTARDPLPTMAGVQRISQTSGRAPRAAR